MDKDELDTFMQTLTVKDLKEVIGEYKKVTGISKYRKAELVEAFLTLLSDFEQEEAYNKWKPLKIKELISKAVSMLTRWKNTKFTLNDEDQEYSIGVTWQGGEVDTCIVSVLDNKVEHKCSCRLGERGGLCAHLMGLLSLLYLRKIITLDQFPFKLEDVWMKPVKDVEDNIQARFSDTNDSDIELDEYWIFINEENGTISVRWEGDYADTRTYDIKEINANEKDKKKHLTVEDWVVTKVADITVKFLGKSGHIREIVTDKYGVIDKIMNNPKQLKRVKGAYERAAKKFDKESYPQTNEEIRAALRIGLIE